MANATRNVSLRRQLLSEFVTLTLLVDFSSWGETKRSNRCVVMTEFWRKLAKRFERSPLEYLLVPLRNRKRLNEKSSRANVKP